MCILAHVDHGKTTLSDHLIASNGLIHPRLAGELRYMDSNEDEQARGITMKSSSISLLHVPSTAVAESSEAVEEQGYLFNLIDSPGHIDFCSEVSTAARLRDGAFVLVDAVEGVCIQTHAVLRQAWEEKLDMCLVVNKIDRLILELELEPKEAYSRIVSIVSNVNMVVSSFESEKYISEADAFLDYQDDAHHIESTNDIDENECDYFSPEKGNVAFGSAYDGWACTVQQFAQMYAEKLQCKAEPLCKALWGNYYFSSKTKRIMPIKSGNDNLAPLFVSWILDPIWKAYESCKPHANHKEILEAISTKLSLNDAMTQRSIKHQDPRVALRALMRSWLSLSEAILSMGVSFLPSPKAAAPKRIGRFLPTIKSDVASDELKESLENIEASISCCDMSVEAPVIIYVSKMVSVPSTSLPRKPGQPARSFDSKEETFLAFGRVFSGTMKAGKEMYVLQADYDPETSVKMESPSLVKLCVPDIYLMMGRGLENLSEVPAGNILALSGLETAILKSATLSSTPLSRPIAPLVFQATPIVQVAVEPAHPGDMDDLERGLKLLHRADPLVRVSLQESGEHVVSAAGEIHLETCIKDLKERFARVELVVSPPLVRFKESVALQKKSSRVIEVHTAGKSCKLRIKISAMSDKVASEIERMEDVLSKTLYGESKVKETDELKQCLKELKECLQEAQTNQAGSFLNRIWQLGPKRHGPNILLASSDDCNLWEEPDENVICVGRSRTKDSESDLHTDGVPQNEEDIIEVSIPVGNPYLSYLLGIQDSIKADGKMPNQETDKIARILSQSGILSETDDRDSLVASTISALHAAVSGISTGFQMASLSGPLCDEPLRGVVVDIEAKLLFSRSAHGLLLQEDVFGPFNGQVSAITRQGIRRALLENDPRIVEAYFLCEMSTSSEGLAAVYAVLGRRRARVLREELKEGSGLFVILAHLPVEASFGFADELRRKSSGSASASLMLSHWERLDLDPFFLPLTEEEREEFGEEGQGVGAPNLAKRLIDTVRRRKGLQVEEKVVESATKQRTRARKV